MSANDIIVIKKEADGKFRGYRRDYDAHCKGQYDEGPCHLCGNEPFHTVEPCDVCGGTGHYPSHEEPVIFEVHTIQEAIHAADEWSNRMMFPVEYGYTFEGLEPNAETVGAMKELDLMTVRDNLKFIFDHVTDTCNAGFVLVNCDPETIREKAGEALDVLNNPLQGVREFETAEELLEELHKPDDTEILDFLQQELIKIGAVSDVRRAIINYMEQDRKEGG